MPREKDELLKQPAGQRTSSVPKRRWGIALLLGLGVLVNYFDRVNLSVSRDALEASFGISAVTFGYLSSTYNWTYALLQLPSGLLLDQLLEVSTESGNIQGQIGLKGRDGNAITPRSLLRNSSNRIVYPEWRRNTKAHH